VKYVLREGSQAFQVLSWSLWGEKKALNMTCFSDRFGEKGLNHFETLFPHPHMVVLYFSVLSFIAITHSGTHTINLKQTVHQKKNQNPDFSVNCLQIVNYLLDSCVIEGLSKSVGNTTGNSIVLCFLFDSSFPLFQ
jgi:hypothetical protein